MQFSFYSGQPAEKNGKKRRITYAIGTAGLALLLAAGCQSREERKGPAGFETYTQELFRSQVSSNTVSLHYTLREPEKFGIEERDVTPGSFASDPEGIRASAENMRRALSGFDYDTLDIQDRITYDILEYEAGLSEKSADYTLYDEPLGLVSGVQTQFPVVLSEYRFYDREDVDTYLQILGMTGEYFDSLIRFEREKAQAGLFMSDHALDAVLEQCRAFLDMGDGNYLYSTFVDRIKDVEGLTEKEKSEYIQDNALAVSDCVFPAYEALITALEDLRGRGRNEKGLVYLPEGRAYYELVVAASTGSDRPVEELEDLTRRQMTDDIEAMEEVLGITYGEAQETAAGMYQAPAETILGKLEEGIKAAFPEAPDTDLEVKYVPDEMEEHLSPAFYMIPAIDHTEENVIYINRAHMSDDLTLFTTLAHEGYPGHLYQTLYYESTDLAPIRSLMDFGGYVEGWATYAEMGSYYLTPLDRELAAILQKNSSVILGLYALADIGIHYDGWSRTETAEFFGNYGITDPEAAERIYDLIIGSPGNYLKYYIGYVEFLELKKDWAEEKGEAFSQKEFHEAVLKVGPAPFDIVEKYMWEM